MTTQLPKRAAGFIPAMQRYTAGTSPAARNALVFLCWISCFGMSGCGGASLYPVEGTVAFKDGTPLQGGVVMFELIGDGPATEWARGEIQPGGTFRLGTAKPNDGAAPGRYRAWVTPPMPSGGEGSFRDPIIHPRFADPQTAGLEFTVERRKNHFKIEVDRP